MLRAFRILPLCVLLAATAVPVAAQGTLSADEKELAAYTITLPTLNKVVAVMRSVSQEMLKDPKYQQLAKVEAQLDDLEAQIEKLQSKDELTKAEETRLESLSDQVDKLREQKEQMEQAVEATEDKSMTNAKSLAEMEQAINKMPVFARALSREGLSAREFSRFMMAMLQAGMAYGFSQGKVDYAKLPPGINPANVKFVAEHQAELNAMQKEFEAMGKAKR
jgi:predicted RNase H-like nuclease (RuvC/YqgF family)